MSIANTVAHPAVSSRTTPPRRRLRAAGRLLVAGALAPLVLLAGCVPQKQYDDLMTAYRAQEQSLLACQAELDSSRSNENALRGQLSRASEDLAALERFRDSQGGDLEKLRQDYLALLKRLEDLRISPLPESLNIALRDLAAKYPDILTFDEKRGMLRFNADFTFDLGDANLKSSAEALIRQLAGILNSADAAPFEIKVLGHTDNVPIGRPETRAKHPTNVHLSAHRAISVRDALMRDGVQAGRIEVAGFGEFRPLVANGARGAAENRRVEVFLTPATGDFNSPASAVRSGGGAAAPPAQRPQARPPEEPLK